MKKSLGLIEVTGLALAIAVSDAMAKVASVELLDIEKTNGSGWMVVKIAGDLASVNAAIATGADVAKKSSGLIAFNVIARPVSDLAAMSMQKESLNAKSKSSTIKAAQIGKEITGTEKTSVRNGSTKTATSGPVPAQKNAAGVKTPKKRAIGKSTVEITISKPLAPTTKKSGVTTSDDKKLTS